MSNRDKLADDKILFRESLIPALQSTHLLLAQTFEVIKWPIKVLCQHILIKAAARQSPTRIATREIRVRSAGAVEVAARCHVEHAAFDCYVDWFAVRAIERSKRLGRESLEQYGRRSRRQGRGRSWAQALIYYKEEEGEENEVDRSSY